MQPTFRHRWWFLLAMPFLLLLLFAPVAQARSWSIPRAEIDLHLEPDGSLQVTERRTYRFRGEYTHIYQKIRLWGQSAIADLALEGPTGPFHQSTDRSPGTYTWDGKRIDWYFQAADVDQTFTLSYRVTDAIAMHEDGAELHWQVIGSEWERGTDGVVATIHLPAAPIDAWVAGDRAPLSIDGQTLRVERSRLPSEQPLAVRILLPREAVAASALPSDGKTVDALLKRAGRRPDPASRSLHYGWTALALLAAFWFYRLHVRRPRVEAPEPPEPLPPVLVARLLGGQPTAAMRAALADLAVTGALRVEQEAGGDWRFTRAPQVPVPALEQPALSLLLPEGRESITLSEWKRTLGKRRETGQALLGWWKELRRELPDDWYLPYRWWGWLLSATVVPLLLLTSPGLSMIAPIAAALLLVLLSIAQRRFTEDGEQVRQAWLAERRRLARGDLDPAAVASALAVGLPLKKMLDPTLDIGRQFAWLLQADAAMGAAYASYAASAGGGGGANGGGGGGAS